MSKIYILALILLISVGNAYSANRVSGIVTDENGNAMPGVYLFWKGTAKGTTSEDNGKFSINTSSKSNVLITNFIGYANDTIRIDGNKNNLKIALKENTQVLGEVVAVGYKASTISSKVSTLQVQKITGDELCRAACCNLSESFETNASVDVAYSDAATGAKQIKLLGLSGTYVQLLTEQLPNLQGAASNYGLSYIPGPWMESIQISKGTSSVKNGYEALTGQINVEYKKPQLSDALSVNLFGSSEGRLEGNMDANFKLNDKLSTGVFFNYSNAKREHDKNKDGFMDSPSIEQFNALNRWYYKSNNYMFQALANVIHEDRNGGQIAKVVDNPYKIHMKTDRAFVFTKNGYILNKESNSSIALLLSGTYHNQKSTMGVNKYDVNQKNIYSNLIFETEFTENHKLSTGVSFIYDKYDEKLDMINLETPQNLPNLYRNEMVGGAYAQYTFNYTDKLSLMAGIRADYHNEHKLFATPRLHIKYSPFNDNLSFRATVGRGVRTANVLVENSYLLATNRKYNFANNLDKFESAWNYGISTHFTIPLFGKPMSVMLDYYYTDFQNQVIVDLENPQYVYFYNLEKGGKSYAQNAQIEVSYPAFRGFNVTGAFRITDVKTTYNGELKEKPLTNKYKGLITASYQTRLKKWQYDVTAQFNGGGRMPSPGTFGDWNSRFGAYTILNAQVTRNFRTWSIYAGGENLTNFKQSNPIIGAENPWMGNENGLFDSSMAWGPISGAMFYVGMRWSLENWKKQ